MEIRFRTNAFNGGKLLSIMAVFNPQTGKLSFHKKWEGEGIDPKPIESLQMVVDGETVEIEGGNLHTVTAHEYHLHEKENLSEEYLNNIYLRMNYAGRTIFNREHELAAYEQFQADFLKSKEVA